MVEIFIDADACPVKNEAMTVAERHGLKINVAGNMWLRLPPMRVEVTQILVPATPDSADNWIAEHITANDVVVTNDIPLARRCLDKKAFAIRPNGDVFSDSNIGLELGMRELNSFLREIGEKSSQGRSFTQKDRSNFLSAFENIIQKAKRKSLE